MNKHNNDHQKISLIPGLPEKAQSGQAIVLIAMMLVILLGFVGLAIDGGNLYYTQRTAQNAVDHALLAAVQAKCANYDTRGTAAHNSAINQAVLSAAAANGFNNDGVDNVVTTHTPPASGPATGNLDYVEVIVWKDAPTYFIQVIYEGVSEVTVRGVGQCRPAVLPFDSSAFVALGGDDGCTGGNPWGIRFSGNGTVRTIGAGVHTNEVCDEAPNKCAVEVTSNKTTPIIDDPGITAVGCIADEHDQVDGTITPHQPHIDDPLADIEPPNGACGGAAQSVSVTNNQNVTINPGYYSLIRVNGGTLTMNPGLYCLNGTGLVLNGGVVTANGVTVYVQDGGIAMGGNGDYSFVAPDKDSCIPATTCKWQGMLFWEDSVDSPTDDVVLNGSGNSEFTGTVYAPHLKCTIVGNGTNLSLQTQLICRQIEVTGTGDITIIWTPNVYTIPPSLVVNE